MRVEGLLKRTGAMERFRLYVFQLRQVQRNLRDGMGLVRRSRNRTAKADRNTEDRKMKRHSIFLCAAHKAVRAASESLAVDQTRVHVVITDVRESDPAHESSVVKVPSGSGASKTPGRSIKSTLQLR